MNRIDFTDRTRKKLQLEVNDLSGGFVSQAASYQIDERFLVDVQNMELVQGLWQKRKGFHLSGSFSAIAPNPGTNKGVHVFMTQSHMHVLSVYGNKLYDTYQLTQQNAAKMVTSSFPITQRVRFADFRNDCYIAHGQGSLYKYDGDKLTTLHTLTGNIIASYDNRLLLAGIKGDPLVVYFSERGDGSKWEPTNYIVLDGGSDEKITALIPLQGKLYIFTNRSIYSLIGTMENFALSKEVEGVGAVSAEAIQVFGNRFYFMMGNGKMFEYDGGNFPTEISLHITKYIESKTTPSAIQNVVTTYYQDSVWFTLDTSYVPDHRLTLVYYPESRAWSKFTGIPAAHYFYVNDALFFTGAHDEGSIYQFGTQYSDDAYAIDAYLKTSKWSFNALENLKRFKVIYVRGTTQGGGGNGFDIDFLIDDSLVASVRATTDIATETEVWGENTWGDMYWGYAPETSGAIWGQTTWNNFEWAGAEVVYAPKWGTAVWGAFEWGDNKDGVLDEDVGTVYRKVYLSQYNVVSGKTLQLVLRDRTPNHGFRFEHLRLEYIQKGAR